MSAAFTIWLIIHESFKVLSQVQLGSVILEEVAALAHGPTAQVSGYRGEVFPVFSEQMEVASLLIVLPAVVLLDIC